MDGSAFSLVFFGTQPATTQIEDLLAEKSECVKRKHRVLVTANRRTSKTMTIAAGNGPRGLVLITKVGVAFEFSPNRSRFERNFTMILIGGL